MRFFKENSYDIVKLFINQIGIAIFSLSLYAAVALAIPEDFAYTYIIDILISLFSTGFYLALIYTVTWECGAKDKIRIDSGRLEHRPYRGALLGAFANLPNFVIVGVALICMSAYLLGAPEGFKAVFSVLNLIFGFLESMYLGVIISIFSATGTASDSIFLYRAILYFVMPLLSILACHVGYALGSRDFRILSLFSSSSRDGKAKK